MVHPGREVTANRPDIIIKHQKETTCNTSGQKCLAKGGREETKIQAFMYRDKTTAVHEMYDHTGNNWSHRYSNKRCKETFGSRTRKTFNRVTTKDSCTWNIT
jgi:hypothetical protein